MYKSFFGLRVLPFGASSDPRFLFLRPQIREALACLQYGIAARRGFVVLTGEVGTDKTTLLKIVLGTFDKERIAGATGPVFIPEAAELVYHYSKGIPRIINLICEHTLIFAYAEQINPIPAHIIESVGLELDLVQHPFTISFAAMQALMTRTLQPNSLTPSLPSPTARIH
jgi:type II secretory pathway predicted ATPase ExeA